MLTFHRLTQMPLYLLFFNSNLSFKTFFTSTFKKLKVTSHLSSMASTSLSYIRLYPPQNICPIYSFKLCLNSYTEVYFFLLKPSLAIAILVFISWLHFISSLSQVPILLELVPSFHDISQVYLSNHNFTLIFISHSLHSLLKFFIHCLFGFC